MTARFRCPSPSPTAHSKTPTARARLGCKQPKHNRKRVLSGPCRRLHSAVDLTHAPAFTIINPTHHTRTRLSYCYNILHLRTHAQATKAISKFTRSVRVARIRGASIYIAGTRVPRSKGRVLLVRRAHYWRAVVVEPPPDREVRVMLMAKGDMR